MRDPGINLPWCLATNHIMSKQKITDEIRKNLFSSDETVVRKAIDQCREDGSAALVEPLIAYFASSAPDTLRSEVGSMLGTLKVTKVEPFFLTALENKDMAHIHKDLIGFMWSSGLNPGMGLSLITRHAINGDLATTLECLTLIENIEDELPEEAILESISLVRQSLPDVHDDGRRKLLTEYLRFLNLMRAESEME